MDIIIERIVSNDPTLIELDLSHRNITNKIAVSLMQAALMTRNTSLLSLNLSHNKISFTNCCGWIGHGRRWTSSLTALDLSNNIIGDNGATFLSNIIAHNTSIKVLNVSHNELRSWGGHEVANGLFSNTALEKLDLSSNLLGDSGACEIAACRRPRCLHLVDVRGNNISEKGQRNIDFSNAIEQMFFNHTRLMFIRGLHSPNSPISILPHDLTIIKDIFSLLKSHIPRVEYQ